MSARACLNAELQAVAAEDLAGVIMEFARSTAIDALEAEPRLLIGRQRPTRALVVVDTPGRQVHLSADTGRRVALLLSEANRNGAALALWEACDEAEELARRIDRGEGRP